MNLEIITKEDLNDFGKNLIEEIKKIILAEKPVLKKHLKGHEVRKMLGISQGTLQNLRLNGTLPYTKLGNIYFYLSETIEKLMSDNGYNSAAKSQYQSKSDESEE